MRLTRLAARRYRSIRGDALDVGPLNLLIGVNAAGKSNVLDALRFLHDGVAARDFRSAMFARGGIIHLAWKGEPAQRTSLAASFADGDATYEWHVNLVREGYDFHVEERLTLQRSSAEPPTSLLDAQKGHGWWWSDERRRQVPLEQEPTACALVAAAADASFEAREVAEFVRRWGFFDPSPFLLRRDWASLSSTGLDPYGRNLAETLHSLQRSRPEAFEAIVEATQSVLGLPVSIEFREANDRFYFVQEEPGLDYRVHQMGASSGTLRMLALMTALLAEPKTNLIGIEEPENYVHPAALSAFAQHLKNARARVQLLVTTHSPLLLDSLGDPAAVRVVRRGSDGATTILAKENPEAVQRALEASGFGLGEFHETRGFGAE